ncbi:M28 family peptidase [Fuerstiella marisgermanici]|uniref:Arginyl aminopeptidase n=1 Tax=Fuerstiella marisgermanici TaxID=1891926 RepID=A0A1P8WHB1_9PLAN|nr:M28 family peptidase [Fuerstiella marisgermanici]APZ93449.1 Arginyl aminopeptidase [Fuerstiella marisgermanici]
MNFRSAIKSVVLCFVCSSLLPFAVAQEQDDITATDPAAAAKQEGQLLRRTRQLTYEGRRAGEGYFSADGRQMVFQSERYDGNPFFQIYLLNRDTGDTELISPGHGKTTCAWIHPDGEKVLYASTQDDPDAKQEQADEIARRESGKERRYSWDYDAFYDIYEYDLKTKEYKNLTDAKGYDAEGSWSPDGKLIAFASNRSAYQEKLTDKQQKMFEQDPAWASEIYLMNSDGSNVRRLTKTPGYDGGPFFSPDGKHICWRRFSENGATAEIMTMDVTGENQKQLTHLETMSWAPYYHPSGDYLIFTTNKHGFANFELYIVDREGQKEPVRVTYTAGFDGLPVFTPDGTQLSWTTNRTTNNQSQIFIAEWDHKQALKLLGLESKSETEQPQMASKSAAGRAPGARQDFAPADAVRHVEYLCRPQLQGRLTGTKGEKLATNYVALYLETLGLEPAGDDGSWFQEFEFTSGVSAGDNNKLQAGETSYELHKDWRPLVFSKTGDFEAADVVFAGYGIQAPAGDGFEEYDSFVHLDVKDKWVVCFRFMPEDINAERRQYLNSFSSLRFKAMKARDMGARGLIVMSGPTSGVKNQLVPMQFDGSLAGTSLAVLSVSDEVATAWFKDAGKDLAAIQKKMDNGEPAMGFPLKSLKLSASIDIQQEKKTGRNVLGRLQVQDVPAHEIVVVGAHIDHLGAGPNTNSLARGDEASNIHFGADDNASGVAAMLQMAEAMASAKDAGKLEGTRDVIFAAWSGEELGLLGSSHYVKELETMFSQHAAALTPEEKQADKADAPADESTEETDKEKTDAESGPNTGGLHLYIAACLNMDMVGRMQEKLVLQGIGSSGDWQQIVEKANVPLGLPVTLQNDSYIPTDASVFFLHGVPILSAFTGSHGEYHTPRDTPEKLNYEGISKIARFMNLVCRDLINRRKSPNYVMQTKPEDGQRRANLRAYLGTIPDYAESDVTGVMLSGVAKGGPADKAGVKGGDAIIKLAGKAIENIYDYTYAIEALKIGQEVEIVVKRDGKDVTMKVTPGSRD